MDNWKFKLIEYFGLKNFILNKFVFRPPSIPGYEFKGQPYQMFFDGKELESKHLKSECFIVKSDPSKNQLKKNGVQMCPLIYFSNKNTIKDEQILIIYSHGNASDLSHVINFSQNVAAEYEVNVLAYDYTGYGLSLGSDINEKQLGNDLQIVLSFAVHHLGYHLNQIILWGFSLGSGPSTEIGSRYTTLGGVILQAPLASIMIWLEGGDQVQHNDRDIISNISKIGSIKSNVLLIHGKKDSVIDIKHSQLLYDKYIEKRQSDSNIWFIQIENCDHNDISQLIQSAEGMLGQKLNSYFKEVEIERLRQIIGLEQLERPQKEMNRLKEKEEQLKREEKLLELTFNEIEISNGSKISCEGYQTLFSNNNEPQELGGSIAVSQKIPFWMCSNF